MKRRSTLLLFSLPLLGIACTVVPLGRPPESRVSEHVDEYHEVLVPDPYHWLEDPGTRETKLWIREQREYTQAFLDRTGTRPGIRGRLRELWNFTRYGLPVRRGGRVFFEVNDGLQRHPRLYVLEEDDLDGEPRLVLDPNGLSTDGSASVPRWVPSWDGKLLAYAVSEGGSVWRTWYVLDVDGGRQLPDEVAHTKLDDLVWLGNDRGFFYTRFDPPLVPEGGEEGEAMLAVHDRPDLYVHRLGTSQDEDQMVLERPEDPGVLQTFDVMADRQTLVVEHRDLATRHTELYVARRPQGGRESRTSLASLELQPMFFGFDARYEYIGDDGVTCWVLTDAEAPRGRVMTFDLSASASEAEEDDFLLLPEDQELLEEPEEPEFFHELLPEAEDTIAGVSLVAGRLVVRYLQDAVSRVSVFNAADGIWLEDVPLPGAGTAQGFEGGVDGTRCFFSFANFLTAPTIYRFDVESGRTELFRRPFVPLDPNEFETYQVFYRSVDSKRIPMFLTHRRDLEFTGQNPTYLIADGGFGSTLSPFFSIPHLVWLEMGGVLAVANVRGGSEYGEDWREAARARHKQVTFDDFSSAARWLVRNEYTTPSRLAIGGEFGGGLAVGSMITQDPYLYGAAVISSGLLDMLRFEAFTAGWTWAGEFGTVENRWDFHELLDYSPVHNVKPFHDYPATLVLTADQDDRVVPFHSYKFTAALQAAQSGPAPVLIRIDQRTGLGAEKSVPKQIEEAADVLAFLHQTLDVAGNGQDSCPASWYH